MDGPAYDLLTTMSKYLNLGMPLNDLIASVTSTPAKAMNRPIGTLKPGPKADVTVLNIEKGEFEFTDGDNETLTCDQRFVVQSLIKDGVLL